MKQSLKLSAAQVDSLSALGARYEAVRDSIYTELTNHLAQGGSNYRSRDARRRYLEAIRAVAMAEWRLAPELRALLEPEQANVVFADNGPLRLHAITMDEREVTRFFGGWFVTPY
jgi:hypothetical protein